MSQQHNENVLNNYWDKPDGCVVTIANLVFTEVPRKKSHLQFITSSLGNINMDKRVLLSEETKIKGFAQYAKLNVR